MFLNRYGQSFHSSLLVMEEECSRLPSLIQGKNLKRIIQNCQVTVKREVCLPDREYRKHWGKTVWRSRQAKRDRDHLLFSYCLCCVEKRTCSYLRNLGWKHWKPGLPGMRCESKKFIKQK